MRRFSLFSAHGARMKHRARPATPDLQSKHPAIGVLLGLLLWISVVIIIFTSGYQPHSSLAVGQRAPATVVAEADFTCQDLARTELNKRQAANEVPPVFSINYLPHSTSVRSIDKLFDRLIQVRQHEEQLAPAFNGDAEIADALDLLSVQLTPPEVRQLASAGSEDRVRAAIKSALKESWDQGIVSRIEKDTSYQGIAPSGRITIQQPDGTFRGPVSLLSLRLPEDALNTTVRRITELAPDAGVPESVLQSLLKPWIAPNLVYDRHLTDERRKEVEMAVEPVFMKVRTGTTLIEAGERITSQSLEQLRAHEMRRSQLESPYDRLIKRIGNAGLLLAALIACGGLFHILDRSTLRNHSQILLLILLSLLALLPAKGLLYLSTTARLIPPAVVEFALPLALAPLLASILIGGPTAIAIGIWNSFAMAILFENNFTVFTLGTVVTVIAVLSSRDVRKRSQIYRAGLFVGLAQMLYGVSLAAIMQHSIPVVAAQALAGFASGIVCAFIAGLLIPLFEIVFRITTNLTLLELSDMGNPLLQRLAMEAPGTYHHSIVVANLAQAAAVKIGANGLLARVCAYFHDVGKLAKPEFFTENMLHGENPHDELNPSMSTLLIMSHVKEGISLVRRHKLPPCLADAVAQHHGTSLVSFFYHQAKKREAEEVAAGGKGANGRSVKEESFRYEGPKPQNREMAILSIADSVEAAARSLQKPTPGRIENLVKEIVDAKLADGQLDASNLTLTDLAAIKRSFVFTLANMLHVRIAYSQDENKSLQQAGKTSPGVAEASPPDTVAGGATAIAAVE